MVANIKKVRSSFFYDKKWIQTYNYDESEYVDDYSERIRFLVASGTCVDFYNLGKRLAY